jgi:hypothetical protein
VRCDAVQTGCLLAGVSKEPDGLFRPRHGGSSSHGDFCIYQATMRHTCEDRDVSVVIFRFEEFSRVGLTSERPTAVNPAAGDVTRPVKETCRRLEVIKRGRREGLGRCKWA